MQLNKWSLLVIDRSIYSGVVLNVVFIDRLVGIFHVLYVYVFYIDLWGEVV